MLPSSFLFFFFLLGPCTDLGGGNSFTDANGVLLMGKSNTGKPVICPQKPGVVYQLPPEYSGGYSLAHPQVPQQMGLSVLMTFMV